MPKTKAKPEPRRSLHRHCSPAPSATELRTALEVLVHLQAHYAKILNTIDGGERHPFKNADEWIARLRETGKLANEKLTDAGGSKGENKA